MTSSLAALPMAPPDPARLPLPALRADLHVQRVGSFRDGSPRFRIHDPLRNRYFELGMLDVEILSRWQAGACATEVADAVAGDTGLELDADDVLALRDLLVRYQLVGVGAGQGFATLRQFWLRNRMSWLTWLLHHYLFFRIPLVRPDAWLTRMLPLARRLVSVPVQLTLLLLALVTPFLLAREWTHWLQSFGTMLTVDGLLASGLAAFVVKILHELGHAFVARHYGVRVPVMGVGFLVLWPVLYTDTSDSWKLQDHRTRLRIAAAGVATETALALACLFLWTITPPGALRSALFFLSTTSLLLTLSINASPFMRFDGYFVLSDALDMPNLHERSGAMARWWLWKVLWGVDVPPPEAHRPVMARFLIAFAIVTWIYRAMVFFGIALLVYFAFFKLLGIFLMAVELAWFIVRPVWQEARELWRQRARLAPRWRRLGLLLAGLLAGFTFLAWSGEGRAPALLLAANESRLHAPAAARVTAVKVSAGQIVQAGDVLIELESPDLAYRQLANDARVRRITGELARIPANERVRERARVLEEELAQGLSEQQSVREEQAQLIVRAPHAGRLVDTPADLTPGLWVQPRRLLGRVVDSNQGQVRAWVSESQVRRLALGDQVRFAPRNPDLDSVRGKVTRIDTTGSRQLPHPLLEVRYGGDLTAAQGTKGEWELRQTLYQVDVETTGAASPPTVQFGHVHVPTGPLDALWASLRQLLTVLVRESGF